MGEQTELFDVGPRLLNASRRKFFIHEPDAGKAYRPSNGTEGDMFMERWCDHCAKQGGDAMGWCPIIGRTMAFHPGDEDYPREWRIGSDHQPECTAFQEVSP